LVDVHIHFSLLLTLQASEHLFVACSRVEAGGIFDYSVVGREQKRRVLMAWGPHKLAIPSRIWVVLRPY
jgi:hypothetical protein